MQQLMGIPDPPVRTSGDLFPLGLGVRKWVYLRFGWDILVPEGAGSYRTELAALPPSPPPKRRKVQSTAQAPQQGLVWENRPMHTARR